MSVDGQRTKWLEILPKISIAWVGRTNVTDRQTTDDRQTDGRWHIANMNLSSRSLKIKIVYGSFKVYTTAMLERAGSGVIHERKTTFLITTLKMCEAASVLSMARLTNSDVTWWPPGYWRRTRALPTCLTETLLFLFAVVAPIQDFGNEMALRNFASRGLCWHCENNRRYHGSLCVKSVSCILETFVLCELRRRKWTKCSYVGL